MTVCVCMVPLHDCMYMHGTPAWLYVYVWYPAWLYVYVWYPA
jgi:hypothetical protein